MFNEPTPIGSPLPTPGAPQPATPGAQPQNSPPTGYVTITTNEYESWKHMAIIGWILFIAVFLVGGIAVVSMSESKKTQNNSGYYQR